MSTSRETPCIYVYVYIYVCVCVCVCVYWAVLVSKTDGVEKILYQNRPELGPNQPLTGWKTVRFLCGKAFRAWF